MSEEEHIVKNVLGQPIHITLTKSSKGTYNWEISAHTADLAENERVIEEADKWLRSKYGDEKA